MATPAASILKALVAYFNASQGAGTVYAAVGGRLYIAVAKGDTAHPYIVLDVISHEVNYVYQAAKKATERMRAQFTIISDSVGDASECAAILDKLRTRFDDATLSFASSDYTTMQTRRSSSIGPLHADGRMVATQDYIVEVAQV